MEIDRPFSFSSFYWECRLSRPFRLNAFIMSILMLVGFETASNAEDQLITSDGEILHGKLISRDGGQIVFHSNSFGEVRVAESSVEVKTNVSKAEALSGTKNAPLTLPNTPSGVKDTASSDEVADSEDTREKTRQWMRLPDGMSLEAGLGMGFFSGETTGRNISTSLKIDYDSGRYLSAFGGRYRYAEVQRTRVVDDYRLYGGTDRYFGDIKNRKYFAMIKGIYSSDRVHLLASQTDSFFGLGLDVKTGKRFNFRMASGYSAEWEDFLGDSSDGVADAPRVQRNKVFFHEGLTLKLGNKLSLSQDGIFSFDLENYSHRDFRVNSKLSYSMTSHLSLDLVYTLEFDNTSAEGIEDDISNVTIQLGYRL